MGMYVVVAQFPPSIHSQWAVRASLGVVGNEGSKYDHPLRLLPVQPEGTRADGDVSKVWACPARVRLPHDTCG